MTWILRQLAGVLGPYIVSAFAVTLLGLALWLGWLHVVTLPGLRADITKADAQRVSALADAQIARGDTALCRASLQAQNAAVEQLQGQCSAKSEAATTAALRAVHKPITRPAGQSAMEIHEWLESELRPSPAP